MSNDIAHDLDKEESESFIFVINGLQYKMRYPTTEEVEKQGKMTDEEAGEFMFTFITPVNADDPPIKETLKKVTVKKLSFFNKMVISEFGG